MAASSLHTRGRLEVLHIVMAEKRGKWKCAISTRLVVAAAAFVFLSADEMSCIYTEQI